MNLSLEEENQAHLVERRVVGLLCVLLSTLRHCWTPSFRTSKVQRHNSCIYAAGQSRTGLWLHLQHESTEEGAGCFCCWGYSWELVALFLACSSVPALSPCFIWKHQGMTSLGSWFVEERTCSSHIFYTARFSTWPFWDLAVRTLKARSS